MPRNHEAYKAYQRQYAHTHAAEAKVRSARWRAENQDWIKARRRTYHEENRDRIIAKVNEWRRNNPEKFRAAANAWGAARRARKLAAEGNGYTADDIARLYDQQKGRCWWCPSKLGTSYHADHRIPLAKRGRHDKDNIVLACPPCNRRKGDKMPWEFAGRLL